ncbi:MAG: integrase core domain-containing protein [Nocardioidaceae bacterium]
MERFQQTMKGWLRAQPDQPTNIDDLPALLDAFAEEYNERRPHRSLEHRATPSTDDRNDDTHDRVRHDKVDTVDKITWRYWVRPSGMS